MREHHSTLETENEILRRQLNNRSDDDSQSGFVHALQNYRKHSCLSYSVQYGTVAVQCRANQFNALHSISLYYITAYGSLYNNYSETRNLINQNLNSMLFYIKQL